MCDTSLARQPGAIRPRWVALYAIVAPQVAALGVVEALQSPTAPRLALRCVLALGLFATMAVWLRANRPAFDLQNSYDCAGQRMTVRVIQSRAPVSPTRPLEPPVSVPTSADEEYEFAGR
jgi:hypothetical protein